jgi:hypothetical protein
MLFSNMMIKIIPTGTNISAVLAWVGKGAREVNVLHMLPQVGPVCADLAAHGAPVAARPALGVPLYETIQLPVRF